MHTRAQTQNHQNHTQTHSHKMCTCTPEHVSMHVRAHLHERAYMQKMHISKHACKRTHACTPMKNRVYALAHLCTKVHIHTHARTHARAHTPTNTHTYMITNIHKYKRGLVCICTLLHVHRQTDGWMEVWCLRKCTHT